MGKTINERGCIDAGEEWLGRNVIVVAGVAVGIAFLQVLFLFVSFTFCFIIENKHLKNNKGSLHCIWMTQMVCVYILLFRFLVFVLHRTYGQIYLPRWPSGDDGDRPLLLSNHHHHHQ